MGDHSFTVIVSSYLISIFSDRSTLAQSSHPAAWILLVIFLLYFIKTNNERRNNGLFGELGELYMKCQQKGSNSRNTPFSRKIMNFSMTLSAYSQRAYSFLRTSLSKCLPSRSTLTRFRNKVDGSPGFSTAALKMIKTKTGEMKANGKDLYLSLSCDDISIRSHLWFNGKTYFGFEDLGDGPGKEKAKHVMMLFVVSINSDWKVPIAYFLLPDKFKGRNRAELIRQAVYKLNDTGAVITNIVMDNCPVNYSTYKSLGCEFSRKYEDLDTSTELKNTKGKSILALFDAPHLLKLVRNALGHWHTIIDWNNQPIEWNLIVSLHKHQVENKLKLANKLSKQHIDFQKNSMKVKFATQTISRSVADALDTMQELNVDGFQNVKPTIEYLKIFDTLFDLMNSHYLSQRYSKAPLQPKNEEEWNTVFVRSASYICNLKTKTGKPVLKSERYAAFLGLEIHSQSSSNVSICVHCLHQSINQGLSE